MSVLQLQNRLHFPGSLDCKTQENIKAEKKNPAARKMEEIICIYSVVTVSISKYLVEII